MPRGPRGFKEKRRLRDLVLPQFGNSKNIRSVPLSLAFWRRLG
jgi:hypothetical protein